MLVIPAIDLKDGKCVRLRQGRMEDSTVFAGDPIEVANRWVAAGARRLHLVDLNGAFDGKPVNSQIVHDICTAHPDLPVQIGGGIRDQTTIEHYLNAGAQYVIIGTKAITHPDFISEVCASFPQQVIVGLDAKDGKVAIEGWVKISDKDAIEVAQNLESDGVESIVYTDISRDGMMQGVNIEATVKMAQSVDIPIIASGGITTLQDIKGLVKVAQQGIMGAITGRAIYEGTLDLTQAQEYADNPL